MKIWNHSLEGSYPDKELRLIVGTPLYGARVLAITNPGDVVQLSCLVEREVPAIREHYERVELTHATDILLDDEVQV